MRFVVARRIGKRGEGLGNEMLAWSKGFIASQVLRAKLVGPAWGINRRRYYRHFRSSRFDILWEELLTRFRHYRFTEQDYVRIGRTDFGEAIKTWAQEKGLTRKSSYIVSVDGMYGGYGAIRSARPFLWSKLLNSRDALDNVYEVSSRLDAQKLFVAVHMRTGGDFDVLKADESARNRFNIRVPADWYTLICRSLRAAFGDDVQFHFFTDRGGKEFDEIVAEFNPGQVRQSGLTECSDLALMAMADLRVCSVSSYSLVASFLANGPYIWYEPQLAYESGMYSLWGHEANQRLPNSPTRRAVAEAGQRIGIFTNPELLKAYPVRADGEIPSSLVTQLRRILIGKSDSANLLNYGVVPDWMLAPQ